MKTEMKLTARELERRTKAFLSLGLFVTSSLALLAFSWKSPIYQNLKIKEERLADVPIIEIIEEKEEPIIEPISKPQPKQEISLPKSDALVTDYKAKENTGKSEPIVSVSNANVLIDVPIGPAPPLDFLVEYPNQEAMFEGSWTQFLRSNLSYPEESRIFNEEGTIYLSFVVDKNGEISNVEVLPGSARSKALQKEALRVLKSSPKWKPAIHEGEKVKSLKKVQINFKLEG
jgi:protein TonB